MTDEEILKQDFYDFLGTGAIFTTDKDKIEWYRENMENNEVIE